MTRCEYTVLVALKNMRDEVIGAKTVRCPNEGRPIPLDDDPHEVMVLCREHEHQANDPVWTEET